MQWKGWYKKYLNAKYAKNGTTDIWYAWYPVKFEDTDTWVWLENVKRTYRYAYGTQWYKYHPIVKE